MTNLEKKVLSLIDEKEVIEFMQQLIRCNSCYPPGNTLAVAQVCQKKLKEAGIEVQLVTPPPEIKGAMEDQVDNRNIPSVLAWLRGEGERQMLWNAHIDTVPVEDAHNWRHDPFSGVLEEDCYLYGRGAGDDKGSVGAQVMAAVALKRSKVKLKGTLVINPVADEEGHGLRGTAWLRDAGYYKPDLVIIGEQTNNRVAIAERAYMFFTVIIKGKACHGAMPWNGNNAAVKAARLIDLIDRELVPALEKRTHPYLPHSTINIAKVYSGCKENVVPELAQVTIDRRIVPGETLEGAAQEVRDLLERLRAEDPFEYELRFDYRSGVPTDTAPDDPLVQDMLYSAEQVTGQAQEPIGYQQGSDSRWFAGMGVPIAIFGPSDPAVGHAANERVAVKQVVDAAKVYALTAMRTLGVCETE
ncbi:MAG: M20 family metallopeptidase [Anaerotruncus sp.]|nr:M20 family metallopeptidase [Anaerotruncus sp.]